MHSTKSKFEERNRTVSQRNSNQEYLASKQAKRYLIQLSVKLLNNQSIVFINSSYCCRLLYIIGLSFSCAIHRATRMYCRQGTLESVLLDKGCICLVICLLRFAVKFPSFNWLHLGIFCFYHYKLLKIDL